MNYLGCVVYTLPCSIFRGVQANISGVYTCFRCLCELFSSCSGLIRFHNFLGGWSILLVYFLSILLEFIFPFMAFINFLFSWLLAVDCFPRSCVMAAWFPCLKSPLEAVSRMCSCFCYPITLLGLLFCLNSYPFFLYLLVSLVLPFILVCSVTYRFLILPFSVCLASSVFVFCHLLSRLLFSFFLSIGISGSVIYSFRILFT